MHSTLRIYFVPDKWSSEAKVDECRVFIRHSGMWACDKAVPQQDIKVMCWTVFAVARTILLQKYHIFDKLPHKYAGQYDSQTALCRD